MNLVQNLLIKIKKCPWTRSMKMVHGPGPKRGSMDPWSMFCPHPFKSDFTPSTLVSMASDNELMSNLLISQM